MKQIISLLLLPVLLSCSQTVQQDSSDVKAKNIHLNKCEKSVQFWDIKLCLPSIDGMTECYSNPIVKAKSDQLEDESSFILGYYLNNSTYQQVDKLDEIFFDDYFKVFSLNALKGKIVATSQLDEIMDKITESFNKDNWDEIKKRIEKNNDYFSIGQMVLTERYQPNEQTRAGVVFSKVQTDSYESVLVCVLNIVQVKDRLVIFSYYKNYEGEESIKKAKAKSDYFALLLVEENK